MALDKIFKLFETTQAQGGISTIQVSIPPAAKDPGVVLGNLLGNFLTLAALLAVIAIVVGGYQIITSNGDPSKVDLGRKTITAAITGIILIALSRIILVTVFDCVKNFNGCF